MHRSRIAPFAKSRPAGFSITEIMLVVGIVSMLTLTISTKVDQIRRKVDDTQLKQAVSQSASVVEGLVAAYPTRDDLIAYFGAPPAANFYYSSFNLAKGTLGLLPGRYQQPVGSLDHLGTALTISERFGMNISM